MIYGWPFLVWLQNKEEMKMKLSISNIAWSKDQDEKVYQFMQDHGFTGLEIAPTRIFEEKPYDHLKEAHTWSFDLRNKYGFEVPSMQSIWYGRQEKVFGTEEERESLIAYTKQAIDFAEAIGCKNLVFGSPRNRNVPEDMPLEISKAIATSFFKTIGDYAYMHHTVIGMEANPAIYHTNFMNTTQETLAFIKDVDSKGLKLNLDVGTMIQNEEEVSILCDHVHLINHVHISEPYLKIIQERSLHKELIKFLIENGYSNYVSIETGNTNHLEDVKQAIDYLSFLTKDEWENFCYERKK